MILGIDWPLKTLEKFHGLSGFYKRFVRDFSVECPFMESAIYNFRTDVLIPYIWRSIDGLLCSLDEGTFGVVLCLLEVDTDESRLCFAEKVVVSFSRKQKAEARCRASLNYTGDLIIL